MPRTIVDLPSSQIKDLDSKCRTMGISRAEAVRRAVHAFLREPTADTEHGFGLWKEGPRKSRAGPNGDEG